jgi:hypothetical protein
VAWLYSAHLLPERNATSDFQTKASMTMGTCCRKTSARQCSITRTRDLWWPWLNDAPALVGVDVGIAMETGTDVAMESAEVTRLGGDLMGIVQARRAAQATMRNIKQNLFFRVRL